MKELKRRNFILTIALILIFISSGNKIIAQNINVTYAPILAQSLFEKSQENNNFLKLYSNNNLSKKTIDDLAYTTSVFLSMDPRDAKLFFKKGMNNLFKLGKITKSEKTLFMKFINNYYDGVNLDVTYTNLKNLKKNSTSNLMSSISSNINTNISNVYSSMSEETAREIMGNVGGVIAAGVYIFISGPVIILEPEILEDVIEIGKKVGEALFDLVTNIIGIFKKDGKGTLNKIANTFNCLAEDIGDIADDLVNVIEDAGKGVVKTIGKIANTIGSIFKEKKSSSFKLGKNGEPDYNPFGSH